MLWTMRMLAVQSKDVVDSNYHLIDTNVLDRGRDDSVHILYATRLRSCRNGSSATYKRKSLLVSVVYS